MARQKLGLQWQSKGEEQKKGEHPAQAQAQAWATKAPQSGASPKERLQVGRPRVINMETTERIQVRIDRELVEALRLFASREKLSISQLVERVVRDWKLNK